MRKPKVFKSVKFLLKQGTKNVTEKLLIKKIILLKEDLTNRPSLWDYNVIDVSALADEMVS